jgi:hypothetical protein
MARSKLVGLLLEAWNDIYRSLADVRPSEATQQRDGGSSFAWTAAHVANQLDAWINVRFRGRAPHSLIGQSRFRIGGTGAADNWEAIRAGVVEVREAARTYLDSVAEEDLGLSVPYEGSLSHLRKTGLSLRYAILRVCAHHYFHIGEIAAKRSLLGQAVGDYPGPLEECI